MRKLIIVALFLSVCFGSAFAEDSSGPTLQETEDWINRYEDKVFTKNDTEGGGSVECYDGNDFKVYCYLEHFKLDSCELKFEYSRLFINTSENTAKADGVDKVSVNIGEIDIEIGRYLYRRISLDCKSRYGDCISINKSGYGREGLVKVGELTATLQFDDPYWAEKMVNALNDASELCEPQESKDENMF